MSPKRGDATETSILVVLLPVMISSTYARDPSGNEMMLRESPETAASASNAPPVSDCLNVLIDVRTATTTYPNAPDAFACRIPFAHASIRASFAAGVPDGIESICC
jgi:hypothetical protein